MTNAPEEKANEATSPETGSSETGSSGISAGRQKSGGAPEERGAHRARFLAELPDHAELRALGEAFEAGNYALVRQRAPALLDDDDAAVRAATKDLLARIEPDPLVKYMLFLSLLLLIAVTAFAYGGHGH